MNQTFWIPIDFAPKDGTQLILGYHDYNNGHWKVTTGHFSMDGEEPGWVEDDVYREETLLNKVTHYMLIPPISSEVK